MHLPSTLRVPLQRARATARLHATIARTPPKALPGHYYSPLTSNDDAERAATWIGDTRAVDDVDLDPAAMDSLADELAPRWADLRTDLRYHREVMFEMPDAAVYHSVLRHLKPLHVIEVGSGYSTAVALDTIETHGLDTQVRCIEPHPERLWALLTDGDDVQLEQALVQDVPLELFDTLGAGDILFIDSTHVVKAGSDVVWTTLRVLPRLRAGVFVHIHDMFWPFEYKAKWLHERRDWNELYFIHAFLSGNPSWRVWFFNDKVWQERPDLVGRYRPETVGDRPGGLWLEKLA